jgi:single-strand DNA-binding protein
MSGETPVTIVGNLTADPELRYTQAGLAVCEFSIASTPRVFDRSTNHWKDGETLFLRASVWRDYAEHVAASLQKGARVVVVGTLRQDVWEDKVTLQKRSTLRLDVDEVGPALRYAMASVTRIRPAGSAAADSWAQSESAAPAPGELIPA